MTRSPIGIGSYGGDPGPVAAIGADVYLLHLPGDNRNAEVIRAANPNVEIWGRFDDGNDNQQVDTSKPARDEAWRWYQYIALRVSQSPAGTFSGCVGICEAWGPDVQWRADFEYWLCLYVQNNIGLHYAWGSVPVGNLEPEQISLFANVITLAYACNHHGYCREQVTRLADETGPYHLWRPLDLWLPECRRLGLPFKRILLGEVGTYFCWQPGMTLEQYASLCIDVARAFGRRCEAEGVELIGAMGFGFETVGAFAPWNMRGAEGILKAAIEADRTQAEPGGDEVPSVGTGFQKCEALVGPWMEDEIYHGLDTPQKTSLAIGEKGYATWRAATNETTAVTDSGDIWTDFGNQSTDGGVLHRVYPKA